MQTRKLAALLCAAAFVLSLFTGVVLAQGGDSDVLVLGNAVQGEAAGESGDAMRSVAGGTGNPVHTPVTIVTDQHVNSKYEFVLKRGDTDNDFTDTAKTKEQVQAQLSRLLSSYRPQTSARLSSAWSGTNPLGLQMQTKDGNGALTTASKQQLVDTINFFRFCAGADSVALDASYKEHTAQAGADFLAENKVIGSGINPHYSADESGDADAITGLHTSNIAAAKRASQTMYDYNILLENLFHDDDAASNFKAMGHRRWLLNNSLKTIGIGYVDPETINGNGYTHLVTYIDGKFGGDGSIEAFPANGAFPVELMNFKGWSISLGRNERFNFDNVTMKVTATFPNGDQKSAYLKRVDGAVDANKAFSGENKNWFGLASGNCGSGQTLIFEPSFIYKDQDYKNTDSLIGTKLSIEIDGITWNYGTWGTAARTVYPVAPIKYTTEFFSQKDTQIVPWSPDSVPSYTPEPTSTATENPAPQLVVCPSNPAVGDDVLLYCANYKDLGIDEFTGRVGLFYQYEGGDGNFYPLETVTGDNSIATFPLNADKINGLSTLAGTTKKLEVYASVAFYTFNSSLAPDNQPAAGGVPIRTTHVTIDLQGQNQIANDAFSAPVVTAAKGASVAGEPVTFTARPAEAGVLNNASVTVKWTVDGKEVSGTMSEDRSESTCTVTADRPGTLTATAAIYFGSAKASPDGKASINVAPSAAPKLTAEHTDGKVSITVSGASGSSQYRWTVNGHRAEGTSASLTIGAPTGSEESAVECEKLGTNNEAVSARSRITILPHDPEKPDVALADGVNNPTKLTPQAGEDLVLTVVRTDSAPTVSGDDSLSMSSRSSGEPQWTVRRGSVELVNGSDYSTSGNTLTIPKVSGSNYTVIAKYDDTNAAAWDFTPTLKDAAEIKMTGSALAGAVAQFSVVAEDGEVKWVANGNEQKERGSALTCIVPNATDQVTVEATLTSGGEPISRTGSYSFAVEKLAPSEIPDYVPPDTEEQPNPGVTASPSPPPSQSPDSGTTGDPSVAPSDGSSGSPSEDPSESESGEPSASASPDPSDSASPTRPSNTGGPALNPGYPTYVPTYNPGSSAPSATSTSSPGASASASGSGELPSASGSATAEPGQPAASAPQPVEFVKGPDGAGKMLVGMTIDADPVDRLVGNLGSWVVIPKGGTFTITDADGNKVEPWEPFATGQFATIRDGDRSVIAEFTIVLKGDVLGAGTLNVAQLVRLARAITGQQSLVGAGHVAGDMNDNGRLEIADLVSMARRLA